jgi:glycosyltransferase involved in cell wall biosynthesis
MENKFRLLYLSFAFPPGLHLRYPSINPAGHGWETQMAAALRSHFDFRSVGILPFPVQELPADADPASGIAHELLLVDQAPELWHRAVSLRQLKREYWGWRKLNWRPQAVLVYNLMPVYNQFIRWLRRQSERPKLVLLLLDSSQLGKELSPWKRLRYRLKPFAALDEDMLGQFDACIGLSAGTKKYAATRQQPFLWMPGACTPSRAPKPAPDAQRAAGPMRFCYFGALAPHAGVLEMTKVFLQTAGESELHICGHGRQSAELEEMAKQSSRLKFHGLLPMPEDCLKFGQSCDVLVSPRPPGHGNENNVPSKLFEYALCGRAMVASRMSGIDEVLGPEAFYFEPDNYAATLRSALELSAKTSRAELHRRGTAISQRVMGEFNWPRQALRMAEFIQRVLNVSAGMSSLY